MTKTKWNPAAKRAMDEALAELFPPLTKKMQEKFAEEMRKENEKQTPNPDNTCKNRKCGGRIVKRVSSLFRNRYNFHTPECERCGRVYRLAEHATPVGIKEFEEILHRPFTI